MRMKNKTHFENGWIMSEPRQVSRSNIVIVIVSLVVGLGMLLGWCLFPNWFWQ
jgi:hypothetical protein